MRTINDVPVLDATKPAKITITPLDVRRGNAKDPSACAAARACMHTLRAAHARVYVGRTFVELPAKTARRYGARPESKRGAVWVRFRTPTALRTEIVSFDRSKQFDPGEYILPPPQPSHRATGKRYGGKTPRGIAAAAARSMDRRKKKKYKRPAARHVLGGVRHYDPDQFVKAVA
jgi:hypothetical protein